MPYFILIAQNVTGQLLALYMPLNSFAPQTILLSLPGPLFYYKCIRATSFTNGSMKFCSFWKFMVRIHEREESETETFAELSYTLNFLTLNLKNISKIFRLEAKRSRGFRDPPFIHGIIHSLRFCNDVNVWFPQQKSFFERENTTHSFSKRSTPCFYNEIPGRKLGSSFFVDFSKLNKRTVYCLFIKEKRFPKFGRQILFSLISEG